MIIIVDYGMGNLGSISNMVRKLGYNVEISSNPTSINKASKLILPGVGAFDKAIKNIKDCGLQDVIISRVKLDKIPIMGICLGMQIMTNKSEEGSSEGLGLIPGEVKKFSFGSTARLKIPHMGWNEIKINKDSRLLNDMYEGARFYFVHSYYTVCRDEHYVLTTSSYGFDFTSSFEKDNLVGVQFHPEKSHKFGMKLMQNFIELF